ncbi:MAG: IS481 family transposase [Gemmatimonadaceae bacterium]
MPWNETTPMDQRLQFVADAQRTDEPFAALCARVGIAPKTGYKWLARYAAEGPAGLAARSRRPHHSPSATPPEVVAALLALRARHPTWGGKKLVAVLARRQPAWPRVAPSTAAALLKRHGLILAPRRRRALGHPGRPTTPLTEPNAVWTADFKGQFKTADGRYCFPLTVADGASRYLLACRALTSTQTREARPVFARLFREYGLPARIRTDNGVPFATTALGRLSPLSVWWVRLGIVPELIEPSHPEQNGRHERMHRTLKAETTRPPAPDRRAQQRAFDRWRASFNGERPHEALGQRPPAACYARSPRPYPARLAPLEYPAHCEVRRVSRNGGVRWHSHWVNVSHVLAEEYVAFEEIGDGLWVVRFGPVPLGRFHERLLRIEDAHGDLARTRRRAAPVLPMSSD